jgi:hypothetical protein
MVEPMYHAKYFMRIVIRRSQLESRLMWSSVAAVFVCPVLAALTFPVSSVPTNFSRQTASVQGDGSISCVNVDSAANTVAFCNFLSEVLGPPAVL